MLIGVEENFDKKIGALTTKLDEVIAALNSK